MNNEAATRALLMFLKGFTSNLKVKEQNILSPITKVDVNQTEPSLRLIGKSQLPQNVTIQVLAPSSSKEKKNYLLSCFFVSEA
jgi:hypothetical protein